MNRLTRGFAIVMVFALLLTGGYSLSSAPGIYQLAERWPNLTFNKPLDIVFLPHGSALIAEKAGLIKLVSPEASTSKAPVVLDLSDQVSTRHNEMGLLSLALHPRYEQTRQLFVNYTADQPRRTVIARVTGFDRSTLTPLLEIPQPWGNHNGGCLRFGPDGYLYIGMGDGGHAGDPTGNGQNLKTLLAAMLRLDVDQPSRERPYGIPADNPLVGNVHDWREEIFAWGLRNPWRFSFDNGELWAGDVGQNDWEEVTLVPRGGNCGWNVREGFATYNRQSLPITLPLVEPLFTYPMSQGKSVVGGYLYRGRQLPELVGQYLFADFFSGNLWSLMRRPGADADVQLQCRTEILIASINPDPEGEPLLLGYDGKIWRISKIEKNP